MNKILKFMLQPDIFTIIVVVLLLVIGRYVFGMKYTSVKTIFSDYITCFQNKDGKLMMVPVFYYFGIPMMASVFIAYKKEIDGNIVNIVTVIVSILTAMLFNTLTVVIEMKSKIRKDPLYYSMDAYLSKKALIQTYYAVMFAILTSIVILIVCLFNVIVKEYSYIQSVILYYLVLLLLINLFMILKKIYKVIDTDMKK